MQDYNVKLCNFRILPARIQHYLISRLPEAAEIEEFVVNFGTLETVIQRRHLNITILREKSPLTYFEYRETHPK